MCIPPPFAPPRIRALIRVPPGYAAARPQFYTEVGVALTTRKEKPIPDGAGEADVDGRKWYSYCWNGPLGEQDTLLKFLRFGISRFRDVR